MTMATDGEDVLDRIAPIVPRALEDYRQAIRRGGALFDDNGITTPLRMAHFFAQVLHETGGLRIRRESMDYSAGRLFEIFGVNNHSAAITHEEAFDLAHNEEQIAERVYGLGNPHKAGELGNTERGDGFRYRGNGLLQMTGRGAHQEAGRAVGVDFENNPDLATTPDHALKPALFEWTKDGLNPFADRNDIRTITLRINGGFIGLTERRVWFNKIFPLLQPGATPEGLIGDPDDDVRSLQRDLNTLGADPKLDVDGRYGAKTRSAVGNFQASAGIVADGIAGPVTKATIKLKLDQIRGG
jgi:putative chitinase